MSPGDFPDVRSATMCNLRFGADCGYSTLRLERFRVLSFHLRSRHRPLHAGDPILGTQEINIPGDGARREAPGNAALLTLALAISLSQFFLAPLLLPMGAWSALALICLCAVTTPLHWGLMHESIHGNLFRDPAANRRAGRVLGNFLGLSWDVMRFGHLLHHSNNRHEFDRPEAVSAGGSRLVAAGPYYLKLLGGDRKST